MEHNLFQPRSFEEGKDAVVGSCNGFTKEQRWESETPAFAKAILQPILIRSDIPKILDYGCGVGRLAKEIINQDPHIELVGVDESLDMLAKAKEYVRDDVRFRVKKPEELDNSIEKFDIVYCVYVLQHVPAIYIREILNRIYDNLQDNGTFIYCSSDYRMAIRFDGQGFFDDRFLGVNLQEEIERKFDKVKPLFTEEDYQNNYILRKMVTGCDGGLAHPAFVYKKKVNKKEEPHILIDDTFSLPPNNTKEATVKVKKIKYQDSKNLILINRLAPGDVLVMTNAIRDLHKAFPGKYKTDIRTPCNEIFANNPYITTLLCDEASYNKALAQFSDRSISSSTPIKVGDCLLLDMQYPMIHTSGTCGWHFGYGHRDWLEELLDICIPQTDIRPEIYLSQSEKDWVSPLVAETGLNIDYWVINAGSKGDYTLKQYPYYQKVVDLLKGKIKFVQIGLKSHNHIPLSGAIDMVGKTDDIRKLFRLIYKATGIVTCVSFPMHIAAAFNKPCVVVAGAREGTRWELYPNQRFIYRNGCLPCATYDGCWKSRLEDCNNKVNDVPKCMTLIKPSDIVREIELYYEGGILTNNKE